MTLIFPFLGALLKHSKGLGGNEYSKHSLTWLSVVGRTQLFVNKDGNHNDNDQHYDGQARYQVNLVLKSKGRDY